MAKIHYSRIKKDTRTGFTIVELLIVVVVIAILAAITIVSYNGISQRATVASLTSDLINISKQLKLEQVSSGAYPATLAAANGGKGVQSSSGTTFQYTVDNSITPQTFGLTATNGKTSWFINQDGKPTAGAFAGHTNGGVLIVTNFATNPGVESNVNGLSGTNGSTVSRDTGLAHSGSASLKVLMAAAASSGNVGATLYNPGNGAVPGVFTPNTTYTVSAWVYNVSATTGLQLVVTGTGYSTRTNPTPFTNTMGSWTRLSSTFTTNSGGSMAMYILNAGNGAASAGDTFYMDDMTVTQTNSTTSFADGNSTGWTWNGAQNNSTSYGPAS